MIIAWIIILLASPISAMKEWIHRNPRYLPFPMGLGNKLQIIAGFGIPVQLERDSLTFGLIVKTNFALPTNASQFTDPEEAFADFSKKKLRSSLYDMIIAVFERLTFGGRDCLLRMICEAAYSPISHNGVLGQILHVILMPSTTDNLALHPDFEAAEELGREAGSNLDCSEMFKNCSTSLLDVISRLESAPFEGRYLKYFNWLK